MLPPPPIIHFSLLFSAGILHFLCYEYVSWSGEVCGLLRIMFLNAKNKTGMQEKQIILEYRYQNNFQLL